MKILSINLFTMNNYSINFGLNDNFLRKIKENYVTGGSVTEFCQKNGISRETYYTNLKKLNLDIEKGKENRQISKNKNHENLYKKIRKNYKSGGDIVEFSKKNNIATSTYYKFLRKIEPNSDEAKKIREQKKKEYKKKFDEKLKKSYEAGEDIETFCKANNIKKVTYYHHLRNLITNKKPIQQFREKIKQDNLKEFDKKIIENYETGGDVLKFCQENGITIHSYYQRLKKYEIPGVTLNNRKHNSKESKELDEKIKEHYKSGGNVRDFCKKIGISHLSYYFRLRNFEDIEQIKNCRKQAKEMQEKEINEKIKENYENCDSIKKFCRENNVSTNIYYIRVKNLGEESKKIRQLNRQKIEEKNKELNQRIIENQKTKSNIKEFCRQNNICQSTYYKKLKAAKTKENKE